MRYTLADKTGHIQGDKGASPSITPAGALRARAGSAAGRPRRAFTLMEIIVAVGAVAIVAVGLASIFNSVGKTVTGGRRLSVLNTYGSLIETQMRRDFENMTRDGFLVIHQQWVDTNGDGKHDATDKVRLYADELDANGRPRRIDELCFFINGKFATARQPLKPGVEATSSVARVYYGHGEVAPYGASTVPDYRKAAPAIDDRAATATVHLGIPPGGGQPEDANPNRLAADWTLLRHITLLAKPDTASAVPIANSDNLFGMSPTNPGDLRYLRDQPTQVALQPAMSSLFRSIATAAPDLANSPPSAFFNLRTRTPGPAETFRFPTAASGIVDIAEGDLADLRAIITGCPQYPNNIGQAPLFYPGPPSRTLFPQDVQGNGRFPNSRPSPSNYTQLDQFHAWMSNALPTDSRNPVAMVPKNDFLADPADAAANAVGSRIRYEPAPTDLLASFKLPSAATPTDEFKQAVLRADQLMLSASNFVPHCSEFIVEWSFGEIDAAGEVVWHGLARPGVRPYPSDGAGNPRPHQTFVGFDNSVTPPRQILHTVTDRLIYGYSPARNAQLDDVELTSYFGWTDPTFNGTAPNPEPILVRSWAWPRMVRVTVTLSDPIDPSIESTFQYIFSTPADPSAGAATQ